MTRLFARRQHTSRAATPPHTRIYAIGDIHARADLLAKTIARIDEDIARRPTHYVAEVYLGDYIDRGPDSSAVIDLLTIRLVQNHAVCLRGNHEAFLEHFLVDASVLEHWERLGGLQTLESYGVHPTRHDTDIDMQRSLLNLFPRSHQLFLQCLRYSYTCGDFLFVHAGIRPNVPLEQQDPADLIWIRNEFLDSAQDHGKCIVHGHTPVPHPDIRHNRINIDTAAWRTGTLTCIAIEGTSILVL